MAGLDLRQVEHVVDQRQQVLPGDIDLLEPLCAAQRGRVVAPQQVRQADDRVHRRADLMAHVGQEARLRAAGPLGLVARGLVALLLGHVAQDGGEQDLPVHRRPRDRHLQRKRSRRRRAGR
ncbi:MAG: hypothetical protein U1F25_18475 [Rubrivivax sp.]